MKRSETRVLAGYLISTKQGTRLIWQAFNSETEYKFRRRFRKIYERVKWEHEMKEAMK